MVFQPALNLFYQVKGIPTSRLGHSSCVYGHTIVVFGGQGNPSFFF